MQHTVIPEPPGFADLPKAEQVRYLQALWDHIASQPGELLVPASHLDLAEQRVAEHRRDPTRARSAYEIIDRLADRAKKSR